MHTNKILAIDLSFSEDISEFPKKYGGIGRVLYQLTKAIPEMYVVGAEGLVNCPRSFSIPIEVGIKIRETGDLTYLHRYLNLGDYSLLFHASPSVHLKTTLKQLVWCPGFSETVHFFNTNILLHNKNTQNPQIINLTTKIYEFVLGVPIPEFQEYKKEDFLFSCGNQYALVNSNVLAHWCKKHKVRVIFAGPIDPNYQATFLNEIDYEWTTYIGEITEQEKIKLLKKARFFVDLASYNINEVRLSVKSALSYGCGILTMPTETMIKIIKNNYNGFLIQNELDFINAWNNQNNIEQKNCYNSVLPYSSQNMISSFVKVLNQLNA